MRIGILALQGAVVPHKEKLVSLGVEAVEVRTPDQLDSVGGLIVPGGESSTFLHLIELNALGDPLLQFAKSRPVFGVCAGAILMALHVQSPEQDSLGIVDIDVERNSYGRQLDSFVDRLSPSGTWNPTEDSMEGVFIRAPRVQRVGKRVEVLAHWKEDPVLLEEGRHLVATFHPELSEGTAIHQYFLSKCREYH